MIDFLELAKKEGTPLFILDHDIIRENYHKFKKKWARVVVTKVQMKSINVISKEPLHSRLKTMCILRK